jgi:hypothetical protein
LKGGGGVAELRRRRSVAERRSIHKRMAKRCAVWDFHFLNICGWKRERKFYYKNFCR